MRIYNDNPRKQTCHLLELVEEGVLDPTETLRAALMWLSESDVYDMSERNDLPRYDEEEELDEEEEEA